MMHASRMLRCVLALQLVAGFSKLSFAAQMPLQLEPTITISGSVNKCYRFVHGFVDLQSASPNTRQSAVFPLGQNREFRITVPAAKFPYGDYYVRFAKNRDVSGSGALRIAIKAPEMNIGQLGDCDV